jgi:nitrogen fixation-related uncharacterized protein
METTVLFLAMIIGFGALAWASFTWGADSRDQYPDDHIR